MEDSISKLEGLLKPENVRISEAIIKELKCNAIRVEVDSTSDHQQVDYFSESMDDHIAFDVYIESSFGDRSAYPYEAKDCCWEIEEVEVERVYYKDQEIKVTEEAIECIKDSIC